VNYERGENPHSQAVADIEAVGKKSRIVLSLSYLFPLLQGPPNPGLPGFPCSVSEFFSVSGFVLRINPTMGALKKIFKNLIKAENCSKKAV